MKERIENFLRIIKLFDNLTMNFNVSKSVFIKKLKANVDYDDGIAMFEEFSSSKNDYKGTVTENSFALRKRRRFMEFNFGLAKINGKLYSKEDNTKVEMTIGLRPFIPLFILAMIIIMYAIGLSSMFTYENSNQGVFGPVFLLFHGLFMLTIFYFVFKKEIISSKKRIERDLFYIINK